MVAPFGDRVEGSPCCPPYFLMRVFLVEVLLPVVEDDYALLVGADNLSGLFIWCAYLNFGGQGRVGLLAQP